MTVGLFSQKICYFSSQLKIIKHVLVCMRHGSLMHTEKRRCRHGNSSQVTWTWAMKMFFADSVNHESKWKNWKILKSQSPWLRSCRRVDKSHHQVVFKSLPITADGLASCGLQNYYIILVYFGNQQQGTLKMGCGDFFICIFNFFYLIGRVLWYTSTCCRFCNRVSIISPFCINPKQCNLYCSHYIFWLD